MFNHYLQRHHYGNYKHACVSSLRILTVCHYSAWYTTRNKKLVFILAAPMEDNFYHMLQLEYIFHD